MKNISLYTFSQRPLAALAFWLGHNSWRPLKNFLIKIFLNMYPINLTEIVEPDPFAYKNFNAFFTRRLKDNARIVNADPTTMVSPGDGIVGEFGKIENQQLIAAKGLNYTLSALLGHENSSQDFLDGSYFTLYLAPKNYHRVHMPFLGTLKKMIYVPGKLFSVNPELLVKIPDLFTKNERVICIFDTALGPMAIVFVGALLVGGIETVWEGCVVPKYQNKLKIWDYSQEPSKNSLTFAKGDEIGHFNFGSTIIVLLPTDKVFWKEEVKNGKEIYYGEAIAAVKGI